MSSISALCCIWPRFLDGGRDTFSGFPVINAAKSRQSLLISAGLTPGTFANSSSNFDLTLSP